MKIWEIVAFVTTMIGTGVGIAGFLAAARAKKKNRSIRWSDLDPAVKTMVLIMKRDFVPDIIYAPTQKSGILLELILPYLQSYTPTIMGAGIAKKNYDLKKASARFLNTEAYFDFETVKWHAYVPKIITDYQNKNILIVDDFAMTGDFLNELKICLISKAGFRPEKIRTMCLATTEVAVNNTTAPNYTWKISDSSIVYFPWGRPQ